MSEATVRIEGRENPLVIRVNGTNPTFRMQTDPIRAAVVAELDSKLLDLLDIAAAVFSLDGAIKRGGDVRSRMGQDWRRRFDISMTVRNPHLWNSPDTAKALVDAVEFLTEDSFRFRFHQAEPDRAAQPFLDLVPAGTAFKAEEVILFSGGLDSFAGALEVLSSGTSKVVLVTHRSAQKAIPRQEKLGKYLSDRFKGRVLHIHVVGRRAGQEAGDSTQRSRSILFAALGQLVAQSFGAKRISFFENGIISHNLPLTPLIVGTMATRTTHPLSLVKLNGLMQYVRPDPVPIENKYRWLTKTEVVGRIAENAGSKQIPLAVSCTSIREQTRHHTHCGACSQCMDRRFAILAAGLEEHDFAIDYRTDVLFGEREGDASRTMALEWTRHSLRLAELDETGFMEAFGLELARIVRGHPETLPRTVLLQTLDMHRRHSRSVRNVLEQVVRDRAADLVAQRIPDTSLLAMHIGQPTQLETGLPDDPRSRRLPKEVIRDVEEVDTIADPNAPLQVAFLKEDDRFVVAVQGLGRVTGQPARVPHALEPDFKKDRTDGLAPDDHRFLLPGRLPLLDGMNKAAIRQNVARCRKTLAEFFEAVHGKAPDAHLLIQSRSPRGLRLDPLIRIVESTQGK